MSLKQMFVPKDITVGYNKRSDTYTGKLSYIIYTDAKGKLRKEPSWESWRDAKLGRDDFENEPTSGFVLNKKVGGGDSGWNHRNTYVRVYDPRGFEFEIDIHNMLFILQESNSIKGKGLEGEFVYAWEGKELVLLPTSCTEYKDCMNYTKQQSGKVTKKDMVEGRTYLRKDMQEVIYLGRQHYYELNSGWYQTSHQMKYVGKRHIFLNTKKIGEQTVRGYSHYIVEKGFTHLSQIVSEDCHPQFADAWDQYMASMYSAPFKNVNIYESEVNLDEFDFNYAHRYLQKVQGKFYLIKFEKTRYTGRDQPEQVDVMCSDVEFNPMLIDQRFDLGDIVRKGGKYDYPYNVNTKNYVTFDKDNLSKYVLYDVSIELANGHEFSITGRRR